MIKHLYKSWRLGLAPCPCLMLVLGSWQAPAGLTCVCSPAPFHDVVSWEQSDRSELDALFTDRLPFWKIQSWGTCCWLMGIFHKSWLPAGVRLLRVRPLLPRTHPIPIEAPTEFQAPQNLIPLGHSEKHISIWIQFSKYICGSAPNMLFTHLKGQRSIPREHMWYTCQ